MVQRQLRKQVQKTGARHLCREGEQADAGRQREVGKGAVTRSIALGKGAGN